MDCDVAVVGGGPAGLSAAAETARAGLRTVVFERDHAIGEPVRTSGGSFIRPLRALGLPSALWHPVHRIRIVGPSVEVAKHYRDPWGCVLDVRAAYQWLASRAVDAGAELRLKARVEKVRFADRVSLSVRDGLHGSTDVTAGVVVDASGHAAVVARESGLRPGGERSAVGLELELYAPAYDEDEAVFWLGGPIGPGGYGWAFPRGGQRVRLGVGVVRPDSDAEPRVLLAALRRRVEQDLGVRVSAGPLEQHAGVMPVLDPRAVRLSGDRVVAVGDAAGQGSTLLGEGIRYAIAAGRAAGRVVAAADGDYRAGALAAYDTAWRRAVGRDLTVAYAVNRRICGYRDPDWDRALRRLAPLSARQAGVLLAGSFTVPWAVGVAFTHPSLLVSLGRALLRGGKSTVRRLPG